MLIKENEDARNMEIVQLKARIEKLTESENKLKKIIQDLETDICDKNKVKEILCMKFILFIRPKLTRLCLYIFQIFLLIF